MAGKGGGLTFLTFFFIDSTAFFNSCLHPSITTVIKIIISSGSSSVAAKMRA